MWKAEDYRGTQRIFVAKYGEKINQARRHFSKCSACTDEQACEVWFRLHDKAESYRTRASSAGAAAHKIERESGKHHRDRPTQV